MKFCILQDEYNWGSEAFALADLGYRDSLVREGWLAGNSIAEVMDTYMDRVVGERVFDYYGRQFPVCVRTLDVDGKLPLQVQPDDETAGQRYDFLGKEKLWYVMSADKDARLMLGFKEDSDATQLFEKCLDNSVEDILNVVSVHAGQCFRIAPGTPHAASGKLCILEIAESSPLDFCLCGWGETVSEEQFDPVLTVTDALDFINYRKYVADCGQGDKLVDLPQLCINRLPLGQALKVSGESFDSFTLYTCVKGEASLQIPVLGETAEFRIKEGETVLVPSECTGFNLVPCAQGTILLDTTVNPPAGEKRFVEATDEDQDNEEDIATAWTTSD